MQQKPLTKKRCFYILEKPVRFSGGLLIWLDQYPRMLVEKVLRH